MITKQDILDRAQEWELRPTVVEKDYVLGWVLAAIAEHPETSEQWVFKGGTCPLAADDVFRCGSCQKLFRHSTNDSSLRVHKAPGGWRCSSRRGYLERVD